MVSIELSAEELLANYLQGFLWADDDWLETDGASATYWQARLPQTTTVEVLPDGRTKWRIKTRIVEQIPDGTDAHQLCVALNRYAAGWSFAYDPMGRAISAIAAICVLPQWDTFFLRLSEKAKLSAWMSDVIAERLAATLGGVPAFSHPRAQSGLRDSFDGTYYYLETLRGRPEWVLDLTRYEFPPIEDIASTVATMVGADPEAVWSDTNSLRILIGPRMGLTAGFDTHPIFGGGWQSSLKMPGRPVTETVGKHLSAITWTLFDSPDTNLLGGWTYEADGLTFRQWNTMSEVRNSEQLGSHTDHSATDLWGFSSTLSDAMGAYSESEPPEDDTGGTGDTTDRAEDRAENIVAAIAEQARGAVTERPAEGDGNADRRLLWLQHRQTLVVAAWFNPMGPTVSSTEVCALPDGTEYLVHFRRHPFAPHYRVLGPLTDGADVSRLHSEATDLLLGESLPNVLALWDNPGCDAAEVPDVLRDCVLRTAEESGADLSADALSVEQTMGRPWEFAAPDASGRVKAAKVSAATRSSSDRGFAAWWEQVSSFENVIANFRCLPDAWDGALNTQNAYGNLRLFDTGPLLVTYSRIGMPGPG